MPNEVLQINDPVNVKVEEGGAQQLLQGVISYINKENDIIGIRLMGTSIGRGNCNGTYKGDQHFSTGEKGAMYVKINQVQKRVLTRFEEIRFRRDLQKLSINNDSLAPPPVPIAMTAPTSSSLSSTSTTARRASSSSSSAAMSTTRRLSSEKSVRDRVAGSRVSNVKRTPDASKRDDNKKSESSSNSSSSSDNRRQSSRLSKNSTPEPTKIESSSAASSRRKSNIKYSPSPSSSNTRSVSSASSSTKSTSERSSVGSLKQLTKQQQRPSIEKQQPSSSSVLIEQKELKSLKLALKDANKDNNKIQEELTTIKASLLIIIESFSSNYDDVTLAAGTENTIALVSTLQKLVDGTISEKSSLKSKVHYLENKTLLHNRKESEYQMKIDSLSLELNKINVKCSFLEKEIDTIKSHQNNNESSQEEEKENIITSLQSRITSYESSKIDTDTIIENLVLEKEQLIEEKEILQDRIEEFTIDLESAQLELEELKIELDDVKEKRNTNISFISSPLPAKNKETNDDNEIDNENDNNDMLCIQNERLRDALVILRDEKILLEDELKNTQQYSANKDILEQELETIKTYRNKLEIEVQELKEMVDEGSAYEKMVEELSDRVLSLESEINKYKGAIQEMEEAADIATETEEELFLENKALTSSIENKDSIILTLHEAIKIQRDREEQLHIDINKYRNTIEQLKNEKTMITRKHHGEEGTKNNLIAASQKALDRAAQFSQDINELRKKDCISAFDKVNLQVTTSRCERLESFFPNNNNNVDIATNEIIIVKGEIMLSKIATMAEVALSYIDSNFDNVLFSKNDYTSSTLSMEQPEIIDDDHSSILVFTDEATHQLNCMLNETKFSSITVDIKAEIYRALYAFQWPKFLTVEFSSKLATVLMHPLTSVDFELCKLLKVYIQEKSLNPQLCNFGQLSESLHNTKVVIGELMDSCNKVILPQDWNPPGLRVMCTLYSSKFLTFGSLASLISILYTLIENESSTPIKNTLESKLSILQQCADEISSQVKIINTQIINLDFQDSNLISSFSEYVLDWKNKSDELFNLLLLSADSQNSNVWELVIKFISQLKILLRSMKKISNFVSEKKVVNTTLDVKKKKLIVPITTKASEPINILENVVQYVSDFTNVDKESMNYQIWARNVRQNIIKAFSNDSKLAASTEKILELEKSLLSRSKEISLLNARVDELVKLLAQVERKDSASLSISGDGESLHNIQEEVKKLKKENQMLHEAMEISLKKTEQNGREIRLLKDFTQVRNTPHKFPTPRRQSHIEYNASASISSPSIDLDAKNRFASPGLASTSKNVTTPRTTPRRSQSLFEHDTSTKMSTPGQSAIEHSSSHIHFSNSISLEAAYFRPCLHAARREMEHWKGEVIRMSLKNMQPLYIPRDSFKTLNAISQGGKTRKTTNTSLTDTSNIVRESREELRLALHNLRMTKISVKVPDVRKDTPLRVQFKSEQLKMKNALNRLEDVSKKANICLVRNGMM